MTGLLLVDLDFNEIVWYSHRPIWYSHKPKRMSTLAIDVYDITINHMV